MAALHALSINGEKTLDWRVHNDSQADHQSGSYRLNLIGKQTSL